MPIRTCTTSIIVMQHIALDPLGEPHTHFHEHDPMQHAHPHVPDLHHLINGTGARGSGPGRREH